MYHDHCPLCEHHSLVADCPRPPDHLTEDERELWLEDYEDTRPISVICRHCGYADEVE